MKAKEMPTGVRERLIEAAGEIFGEQGFHGATIREITKEAGVNLAAVNYYFRDKEELYWEVLLHAVKAVLKDIHPLAQEMPAEQQLELFVAELLRNMLDPSRPDWHGKLISREMSAPTRMLDILVESTMRPRRDVLRKIIAGLAGGPIGEEQEALLCASVMGQCIYYRQNRPVIDRLYPQLMRGTDTIEKLARHITGFSLAGIRALTQPKGGK